MLEGTKLNTSSEFELNNDFNRAEQDSNNIKLYLDELYEDKNKAKKIKKLSIAGIVVFILFFIFLLIVLMVKVATPGTDQTPSWVILSEQSISIFLICILFLSLFISLTSIILTIIIGCLILSIKWKLESINESKILWGILTLLLIGAFGGLVFSIMSIKQIDNKINSIRSKLSNNSSYINK